MDYAAKQTWVRCGAAAATIISVIFIYSGYHYLPFNAPDLPTMGDRIAFVFRCELFAVLMLLAGIIVVGNQRFLDDKAIDGIITNIPNALEINLRYLRNTFEQFILAMIAHLVLITVIDSTSAKIIPVLICWWIIARLVFWAGYHISPIGRAVGFGATFFPTLAVILFDIYKIII